MVKDFRLQQSKRITARINGEVNFGSDFPFPPRKMAKWVLAVCKSYAILIQN